MEVLMKSNIVTGCASEDHEDVIRRSGAMLVASGYVKENYVKGMIERDRSFSTAIGNGIAIPHGAKEYKDDILATGLVVLTYPRGVLWNSDLVKLVIGIAAQGDGHIEILERVVEAFEDAAAVDAVVEANDVEKLYSLLTNGK